MTFGEHVATPTVTLQLVQIPTVVFHSSQYRHLVNTLQNRQLPSNHHSTDGCPQIVAIPTVALKTSLNVTFLTFAPNRHNTDAYFRNVAFLTLCPKNVTIPNHILEMSHFRNLLQTIAIPTHILETSYFRCCVPKNSQY